MDDHDQLTIDISKKIEHDIHEVLVRNIDNFEGIISATHMSYAIISGLCICLAQFNTMLEIKEGVTLRLLMSAFGRCRKHHADMKANAK